MDRKIEELAHKVEILEEMVNELTRRIDETERGLASPVGRERTVSAHSGYGRADTQQGIGDPEYLPVIMP